MAKARQEQGTTAKAIKEISRPFDNLLAINRNADGNYYFIYSVPHVRNNINTKAKARNEVIIVGINQKYLVEYLKNCAKETL